MVTNTTLHEFPIGQNCWVVPDIEPVMQSWLRCGVGPFFVFEVKMPDVLYRGSVVPHEMTIALAQVGPIQLELICPHSDGPSVYRDVVGPEAVGFHHVCRVPGAYDETRTMLVEQGIVIAAEGKMTAGGRFCYADTWETLGCMLELVDDTPFIVDLYTRVREAAVNWDGTDPIRRS